MSVQAQLRLWETATVVLDEASGAWFISVDVS